MRVGAGLGGGSLAGLPVVGERAVEHVDAVGSAGRDGQREAALVGQWRESGAVDQQDVAAVDGESVDGAAVLGGHRDLRTLLHCGEEREVVGNGRRAGARGDGGDEGDDDGEGHGSQELLLHTGHAGHPMLGKPNFQSGAVMSASATRSDTPRPHRPGTDRQPSSVRFGRGRRGGAGGVGGWRWRSGRTRRSRRWPFLTFGRAVTAGNQRLLRRWRTPERRPLSHPLLT